MQRMAKKFIAEKLQNPVTRPNSKSAVDQRRFGGLIRHKSMNNNSETVPSSSSSSSSNRSHLVRTYSVKSHQPAGRAQCRAYRAPGAGEVLIKRALAPPKRRLPLRWWNFRPTPSRLSNMSTA